MASPSPAVSAFAAGPRGLSRGCHAPTPAGGLVTGRQLAALLPASRAPAWAGTQRLPLPRPRQREPGQADGERQHSPALLLPDGQRRVPEAAAARQGVHRDR